MFNAVLNLHGITIFSKFVLANKKPIAFQSFTLAQKQGSKTQHETMYANTFNAICFHQNK